VRREDEDVAARARSTGRALASLLVFVVLVASMAGDPAEARTTARSRRDGSLWSAAREGDLARVRTLLAEGKPIDERGPRGRTALAWAVYARKAEVVPVLLEAGADPLEGRNEDTALALSLRARRLALLPALAAGLRGKPTTRTREFLAFVVNGGKGRPLASLLSAGFDADTLDPFGWPLLVLAAREGKLASGRVLLDKGADVDAVKRGAGTALDVGMRRRNFDFVALLTSYGASWARASAETRALRPVALAMGADLSVLDWLSRHEALASRDADGRTLLHLAARAGTGEALRILLERGASVDATVRRAGMDTGWTALMLAAAEPGVENVARLVLAGADINHRSTSGYTPLLAAAFYGRAETVRFLMERGAVASAADAEGLFAPGPLAAAGGYVAAATLFGLEARVRPEESLPTPRPGAAATPAPASGKATAVPSASTPRKPASAPAKEHKP
jgi:ankyrin repeat protein